MKSQQLTPEQMYNRKVVRSGGMATCILHENPDGTMVLHPVWVKDQPTDFDVLHEIYSNSEGYHQHIITIGGKDHLVTQRVFQRYTFNEEMVFQNEKKSKPTFLSYTIFGLGIFGGFSLSYNALEFLINLF